MSIIRSLTKLKAIFGVALLICLSPLLLLAALVFKIGYYLYSFLAKKRRNVEGEVALVTGAAHGLGRSIALELARIGCHIAVLDIDLRGAEETVKQINEIASVRAKAYKVNVANYTELMDASVNISRDLGPVTVLVNNAGILLLKNALRPEPQDIQRMIDVNLTSHFWTKDIFLPTMKQLRKGNIITICSLAGILPLPYNTTYTATKFGVLGHMKALRMELELERQGNIHVCTAMPSFLETNTEITEMAKTVEFNQLYPLITGDEAAHRIVEGMLRGEREIMLPGFVAALYRIIVLLPVGWQESLILLISNKMFRKFYTYYDS